MTPAKETKIVNRGKYEDLVEDITDNCKGPDELFAKYGLNDNKEGSCR